MTSNVPRRHWRSDGTKPLPTAQQALDEPFAAFPSWFLRIECGRCGTERILNESHATNVQRGMLCAICWRRLGTKALAGAWQRRSC
jgi:hypothetical protein